ncbi:MAG: hypothetical protein Q9183_001335 [Haloplaca sp. 2 TL-2023]
MSSPPLSSFEQYLSVPKKRSLEDITARRTFSSSSALSTASIDNFFDAKVNDKKLELEYHKLMVSGLQEAFRDGHLSKDMLDKALKISASEETSSEEEFLWLKRSHKFVKEDLHEFAPHYSSLEDAYTTMVVNKVMAATAKQKKRKFDQASFKRDVLDYYQAGRHVAVDDTNAYDEAYCLLTGWQNSKSVKAAHIVPKSLRGDEVSYCFGVGDATLRNPRNALPLWRDIEEAMDSGRIVFVPVASKASDFVDWKLVVTDSSILKRLVMPNITWQSLDGQLLKFLGDNRPAKRFLYFRFAITYLECKRDDNLDWVNKVSVRGKLWSTPGPYLRRSMLVTLAWKLSAHYVDPTFYEDTTFIEAEGSAARPQDEEDTLAQSLAARLKKRERERSETDTDTDTEEAAVGDEQ